MQMANRRRNDEQQETTRKRERKNIGGEFFELYRTWTRTIKGDKKSDWRPTRDVWYPVDPWTHRVPQTS